MAAAVFVVLVVLGCFLGQALLSGAFDRSLLEPSVGGRYLKIVPVGKQYFLNDLVGFETTQDGLPLAQTTTHSARPHTLVRAGDSVDRFQLAWSEPYGVSQDQRYPGWGGVTELPPRKGALQLDYYHTMILGRVTMGSRADATLKVVLPWNARVASAGDVRVERHVRSAERTEIELVLSGEGLFQVEATPPPSDGYPVSFQVDGLDRNAIVIGADRVTPDATTFDLRTRDLHSLSVGELDGDTGAEFSVVRGGVRGRIDSTDPLARDLLYDTDEHREVEDVYGGPIKNGCPGRQSSWVDLDGDGKLELFVVCGRASGYNARFPNQVFALEGGQLHDVASRVGLDFEGAGSFRFIDWDDDLQPDLLWVGLEGDIVLYQNDVGKFEEVERVSTPAFGPVPQLLLQDVDEDGAIDLLVFSKPRSFLVRNREGKLDVTSPSDLGLPESVMAGAFIDLDLDGKVDFVTAASGTFMKLENGTFASEVGVSRLDRSFYRDARMASFSSRGERYLLVATEACLPHQLCSWRRRLLEKIRQLDALALMSRRLGLLEPKDWVVSVASRVKAESRNREVAITLAGGPYNPNSLGARIELEHPSGTRRSWVGQSEFSHFSQGNHALYVTVPLQQGVEGRATWQDGCQTTFVLPSRVTHFRVKRPSPCSQVERH